MRNVFERARAGAERARHVPATVRAAARLARQTGLAWRLTRPGLVALAGVFAQRAPNPSHIYRVHAKNSPDEPALVWRGRSRTWAELDARIDRLAAALARRGVGPRRSLMVMMHNRPEAVELGAAVTRIGAAAVTVSWRSTPKELAFLATDSGARAIAIEAALLPALALAAPDLPRELLSNVLVVGGPTEAPGLAPTPLEVLLAEPLGPPPTRRRAADGEAAVVIYTSGTTGKPKGAVRKFPKNTVLAAMRFVNETPMRTGDVHLVACPLYHSTAFGFLSLSHMIGSAAVLMDEFRPEAFLEAIEHHRVTTTAVVPTMLHRVMELPEATRRRYDTRSLRVVFSVGAPLPGPLARAFMDAFGDVLFNAYGATETGLVTLATPRDLRAAPGTIGRALPGNDIRLVDDRGRDVRVGEVGELFVKNDLLVAGYHKDAEATRASMLGGAFSVGDLARRDAAGRFFLEGRKRDMIISGGVNVYPAEIEAALEQHPLVAEVAVVGAPDPDWGERVRAFVVPRAGASLDDASLRAFARERLAGPKVPRDYVLVDALPRNATGKVLKRALRDRG